MDSTALDCDVLVIGSGAAGLATAVTAAHHGLQVIVAEKAEVLGGTSAWSGGWMWIPRNPLAVEEGFVEEAGAAERYLCAELGRDRLDARQLAYLHHGPRMVDFFRRHTRVQFFSGSRMPDMRESPGFAPGGRSLCARPFDGRALGDWIHKLRPPLDLISLGGMGIAGGADLTHFLNATRRPRSAVHAATRLYRHGRDRLLRGRGLHLVNGNALVARLLRSALDAGVTLLTEHAAIELTRYANSVTGAWLQHHGRPLQVVARRGVVLACGGYPHDRTRLAELGQQHHSAAPESNSGDGLRLGEAVGAQLATDLAQPAAWVPVSLMPRRDGSTGAFPHLMERAKPGFIAVRSDGRRFTNEADCYHDFMQDLFASTPEGEQPHAWLIAEAPAQRRYGLGAARPFPFPLRRFLRTGYLQCGATLAELAKRCGIDALQLQRTVAEFNQHALVGEDPLFGRGGSAYNRAQGEPLHGPNPSLGPLTRGPFFAVRLLPGSLGTFAGLRTDANARVIDQGNQPIAGLFAVGNDMASVMDGHYPSGGITLGPGMTFGYLAGLALAERERA
ncbi:FAD-dependent oxidoreductase [Stutzerimonas tarimensis]|uniref:FAD-dependent oxidoreductase n=1 Tax=Stutzerimonas tarimensis TaxID=1507735 RepID=A0ABV7T214_9GAMM